MRPAELHSLSSGETCLTENWHHAGAVALRPLWVRRDAAGKDNVQRELSYEAILLVT